MTYMWRSMQRSKLYIYHLVPQACSCEELNTSFKWLAWPRFPLCAAASSRFGPCGL